MRRVAMLLVMLVGVAAAASLAGRTGAQAGSGPPIAVVELAPGVTAEIFAAAPSALAPSLITQHPRRAVGVPRPACRGGERRDRSCRA